MTELKADADKEALKSWYKPLLDAVVNDMLRLKAVTGTAVEASPVWVLPFEILIAKVWGMGQKHRFIWTISGEKVITDHFRGNLATTPKEVARHFSFKWQGDAHQLLQVAKNRSPVENSQMPMAGYTDKLVQSAELLYDLTERDDIWL